MSRISPYIAALDQFKDQKTQSIVEAFRILALQLDAIPSLTTSSTLNTGSSTPFQFRELPFAATITPTYPADARLFTTRVSMTGDITAFNAPLNIRLGQVYAAIFETDGSARSVTFSSWYSFLTGAPIVIPANSRYVLLMVCTNESAGAQQGRQINAFLQSTGGGGGGTFGPTIVKPTTVGTWTPVNGLTIGASAQDTLILTKATAGAGWCLKAIPTPSNYDLVAGVSSVTFGNYDATTPGISDAVVIECGFGVTNGLVAGTSNARATALYIYPLNGTNRTGFLTRQYNPLNASPLGITGYIRNNVNLTPINPYWFRVTGNSTTINLWVGDGLTWEFITSVPFAASHFGFFLNPTGGLGGSAMSQTVRIVSCSV